MSDLIIFDTSVLVDQLRTDCHRRRIETLNGLIRNCAVVLAELWRGVVTPADREAVVALGRNHPTLTPTEKNWLESGAILAKIRADLGLTARSHGARLITSNRSDFEMVHSYRKFQFEIW